MPQRRPISVCFVIDRLSRAGTETQLLALIRNLDRAEFRPSLVLLNGNDPESRELCPTDCPVLDLGVRYLLSFRSPLAAARLLRFWRENQVDVVQSYLVDSTYFALPLARLTGRSAIRVRNNLGYFLSPLHRRLGRLVGRLAHISLTNSDDGARAMVESDGVPIGRVRVVENGVDMDRFAAVAPLRADQPIVRIGAVANLRPVKNLDGLIRAAAIVCRTRPDVRFELAGEGEQRKSLEELIRQLGLTDRVHLHGAERNVPGFLDRIQVAVLCSHSESMSNALLEYMAAGRAIVVTDVGASARICRDGREGLVVPTGDDAALANAIGRLVDDSALATRLANAARAKVSRDYARPAMVRRFTELYEEVTDRNSAQTEMLRSVCEV